MENIATAGEDGSVDIWDLSSGENIATLLDHSGDACVSFSPCDPYLATAEKDIHLYNTSTWTKLQTFTYHTDYVTSLRFSKMGGKLLSTSIDGTACIWDLETCEQIILFQLPYEIFCGDFNASDNLIALSGDNHNIVILNAITRVEESLLIGHSNSVRTVQYSQDGNLLVSSSYDKSAIIWDMVLCRPLHVLVGDSGVLSHACFDNDNSRIATSSIDGKVCIWNVSTGQCLLIFPLEQRHPCSCIYLSCFSADGRMLIIAGHRNLVSIYDSHTGAWVRDLLGQCHFIVSLAHSFTSTGSYI